MKIKTASLKISYKVALVTISFVGCLAGVASAPGQASSTVTTTTTSSAASATGGLIKVGPSRSECLAPYVTSAGLPALQSAITKFDAITDTSVTCISAYLNGAPSWFAWEHPWITQSVYGYSSWVAEAPQSRELVLQVDLIPMALKNIANPLKWEQSCAAGQFTSYATQLGRNLVAAGLENSVIRLGAEMNGTWEADFTGTTATEQRLWATCFDNEVTGMRRAVGEHFLIDWNPNACKYDLPYSRLYPGNAYVDIMGMDLFDVSCLAPRTPYTFARLANERSGLSSIESFAVAHNKPMSLPEWGLSSIPSGDDPQYIDGIGSIFDNENFAFETYFDGSGGGSKALALGPLTPLSIPAFQRWFSNVQKA
jgi:hypothetical protein